MFKIYNLLLIILTPIFFILFYLRKKNGKENIERFNEKLGKYNIKTTQKKPIWFHTVSVGELMSVIDLILLMAKEEKILITSSTKTSSIIAKEKLTDKNPNIIHQFCPLDKRKYVKSFLEYFKPQKAIFIESELWPNLINETYKKNIPLILLNARISDKKSFFKKYIFRNLAPILFKKFSLILPESKQSLDRLKRLRVLKNKVIYLGNLKLSAKELPFNQDNFKKLNNDLTDRKIFLGASTHKKEEDIIADIHKNLKKNFFSNLLTIIVPRHPQRAEEVIKILKEKNLEFALHSRKERIRKSTDIYLVDTIGELGLFYALSKISFIGGSIANIGGHNPVEAIKLDNIVITGSNIHNFRNLYNDLIKEKSVIKVETTQELENNIKELLMNKKLRNILFKRNKLFLEKNCPSLDKIAKKIKSITY